MTRCLASPAFLLALLFFVGCSAVDLRVTRHRFVPLATEEPSLSAANEAYLAAGNRRLAPAKRLELFTQAALGAWKELPDNPDALRLYNASVQEIGILMQRQGWLQKPPDELPFVMDEKGHGVLPVSLASEVMPASNMRIGRLNERAARPGLGAAFAVHFATDSEFPSGQAGPLPSGTVLPSTLILQPGKGQRQPTLKFLNNWQIDSIRVAGRNQLLAVDFSAMLALQISKGENRLLDAFSMLRTDRRIDQIGLYQLQPYEPDKIPVVFVHGLMSRPEAWTQAVNSLSLDPEIRKRYQFWVFLYPTGLPVWNSAANLRLELDRFNEHFHRGKQSPPIVLIGHSMGGLITSLMIREGGENLWRQFSDISPEDISLSDAARLQLLRLVYFKPRPDVGRAVFVATPHRGSRIALRPIASFGASLIRLPFSPLEPERQNMLAALRDDTRSLFVAPANSIRFLRANSPLLQAILNLPLSEQTPYHSIIGDRGRGNTPNSSDGVVEYWSSHLDGAVSEKIVPSGHGANEHPEGVAEMRRILRQHIGVDQGSDAKKAGP